MADNDVAPSSPRRTLSREFEPTSPRRRRSDLDLSRQARPDPKMKKIISPTRQSRKLMRQISGLDMRDPVYDGFDGCVGDLPESIFINPDGDVDNHELNKSLSVHSDHTASPSNGLDIDMFQTSLSDLHNMSISEFSQAHLSLSSSPRAARKLSGSTGPTSTASSMRDGSLSPVKVQKKRFKEDLNASLVSLELEEAIFGALPEETQEEQVDTRASSTKRFSHSKRQAPSRSDSRRLHSSSGGCALHNSGQLHHSVSSRISSNTDNLLLEAALAADRVGVGRDLVQAAMHNSLQDVRSRRAPTRNRSARNTLIARIPEHKPPPPMRTSTLAPVKPRTLPSMSQIFPGAAEPCKPRREVKRSDALYRSVPKSISSSGSFTEVSC